MNIIYVNIVMLYMNIIFRMNMNMICFFKLAFSTSYADLRQIT